MKKIGHPAGHLSIFALPSSVKTIAAMNEVNFYLKKPVTEDGPSQIYLQFKYNGNRLRFQFGQTIDPDKWNEKKTACKK